VKTVVYRLIVDHQRRHKKRSKQSSVHSNVAEPAAADDAMATQDALFRTSWREELLARSWRKLANDEKRTGKPYQTVLRYRVQHPDMRSPELAAGLSKILGKPINAGAVRVLLHRARDTFAEFLLDEVIESLADGALDEAEQELIDLDLLEYCRPALDQRRKKD
jgi:RNA polymerase sigma-70 factor (ECF subfamily)